MQFRAVAGEPDGPVATSWGLALREVTLARVAHFTLTLLPASARLRLPWLQVTLVP